MHPPSTEHVHIQIGRQGRRPTVEAWPAHHWRLQPVAIQAINAAITALGLNLAAPCNAMGVAVSEIPTRRLAVRLVRRITAIVSAADATILDADRMQGEVEDEA